MAITRVTLIVSLLAKSCIPISADIILEAYHASLRLAGENESSQSLRSLARPDVAEQLLKMLAVEAEESRT